mmetsp:Transcript_88708/g.248188  ORF Transcript_88708/g.248188 Transcript_88708/m.248188 type:complete len:387 (-) Transcript_88708:66-1226(-)
MAGSRRDYKIGRQLGRGSFGVVHHVERKADGQVFVCKEIVLRGMSSKAREQANHEVHLLRKISTSCEYITNYIESFLDRDTLHIIMEYCEHGDLAAYLKAQGGKPLEEAMVWKLALQVCIGIAWLHTNRILHRDIKSLNVFLNSVDDVRVGDLGVARVLSQTSSFAKTLVGTPYYLSPEMCEQKPYNEKSDIWAYGCVVYELCTLQHPFDARNQMALLARIVSGKYKPIAETYSGDLRSVVSSCLLHDMGGRPSAAAILELPAAQPWAAQHGIRLPGEEESPVNKAELRQAKRRWAELNVQISRLHDDAVRDLNAEARLIWDSLYRLLRTKMAEELADEDHQEIERYIFEELPPEYTDLISRAFKILPLQLECDRCMEVIERDRII